MGEEDNNTRNKDTTALLNYGFSNFKIDTIYNKDDSLGSIKINNSKKKNINVYPENNIVDLKNNVDKKDYNIKLELNDVKAPLSKNSVVGKVILYDNENKLSEYNLIIKDDIKKSNYFNYLIDNLKLLFSGN